MSKKRRHEAAAAMTAIVEASKKRIDKQNADLDQKIGSVAARHFNVGTKTNEKQVSVDHLLQAFAVHAKTNIPEEQQDSMSSDDVLAHANDFFAHAAKAHPSLAKHVETPTSRELQKKHGLGDWKG